jgi:hypothetical protein
VTGAEPGAGAGPREDSTAGTGADGTGQPWASKTTNWSTSPTGGAIGVSDGQATT